jgi:hypothetical protein
MPTPEAFRMLSLAFGAIPGQAVAVAAELGVVDQLANGPASAAELAERIGAHPAALHRLLRALASLEVLAEDEREYFSSTPLGDTLRSGAPGSVRGAVMMAGDPTTTRSLGAMSYSVRTGRPAFDHVFGKPFFDYLVEHAEAGTTFNAGMANFAETENPVIAAAYEFPTGARVVDVGGGRGGLIAEILKANSTARGILYDLPEVVCDAHYLAAAGVTGRCEVVAGDFFASVPSGGDVYVVKRILHDWGDEACVALLSRLRAVLAPGGRVLAVDAVLAPPGVADFNKVSDLLMMVVSPGRERTQDEFRRLFADAGLKLTRVISTASALSIVEGAVRP